MMPVSKAVYHRNCLMKMTNVTFDLNADSFDLSLVFEMKHNKNNDIIDVIAKKECEFELDLANVNER